MSHRSRVSRLRAVGSGVLLCGMCAAFPGCRDQEGVPGAPSRRNVAEVPDGGRREGSLVKGIQVALDKGPRPWTDAGILTVTLATPGDLQMWPVDRDALARVLGAMKAETGEALAGALKPHPAVDEALLARARAARGREPLGEVAEAALRGPLSLPVGGQHTPVTPARAALDVEAATAVDATCRDALSRPGAVGQVLAGVGRVRVIMLLQGDELARYNRCVRAAAPRKDAPPEATAEHARLLALLDMALPATGTGLILSLGPAD